MQDTRRRLIASIVVVVGALALMLWLGKWPGIYTFATDQNASPLVRLLTAPIHLDDDVMITLRSGQMLLETGTPSFNHVASAQASTSYLMPYLFAALLAFLPTNVAVGLYGFLGVLAVVATLGMIVFFARSVENGVVLALALAFTVTNLEYGLNAWDHLFQGFLLVVALLLARRALRPSAMVMLGILLAAGSLVRPDGLLLALAIFWIAIRSASDRRRAVLYGGSSFALAFAAVLALNLWQFGHLTPTTTRLKFGAAPALRFIVDYAIQNSVGSFTAFTVMIALLVFVLVARRAFSMRYVWPISIAAVVTAAIAIYNSDFIIGGRMFWVPAVTLAMAVALEAPAVLVPGSDFVKSLAAPSREDATRSQVRIIVAAVVGVILVGVAGLTGIRNAVVSADRMPTSPIAQQYAIADWIRSNLSPADGPIGVFFAGIAFHLPDFEMADFLGKGDELIASLPAKPGAPGHNKWDIDLTLQHTKPQAILPTLMLDVASEDGIESARVWLDSMAPHAYLPDLFFNTHVRSNYRMCYLRDSWGASKTEIGLLLRKDIAVNVGEAARCVDWPASTFAVGQ